MHLTGPQKKENTSRASGSGPFFNLKTAAAAAQALLEAGLYHSVLLVTS